MTEMDPILKMESFHIEILYEDILHVFWKLKYFFWKGENFGQHLINRYWPKPIFGKIKPKYRTKNRFLSIQSCWPSVDQRSHLFKRSISAFKSRAEYPHKVSQREKIPFSLINVWSILVILRENLYLWKSVFPEFGDFGQRLLTTWSTPDDLILETSKGSSELPCSLIPWSEAP